MKKLELKQLLPYVEHNVIFIVDMEKFTDGNHKPEMREFKLNINNIELCLKHVEIKLRPLSELTKHECYTALSDNLRFNIDIIGFPNYLDLKVNDYNILLENHFDIFRLI